MNDPDHICLGDLVRWRTTSGEISPGRYRVREMYLDRVTDTPLARIRSIKGGRSAFQTTCRIDQLIKVSD